MQTSFVLQKNRDIVRNNNKKGHHYYVRFPFGKIFELDKIIFII